MLTLEQLRDDMQGVMRHTPASLWRDALADRLMVVLLAAEVREMEAEERTTERAMCAVAGGSN